MDAANKKFVAQIRAGYTRLAKDAGEVSDANGFTRFVARIVRWNNSRAAMASELMGDPDWSYNMERELRAAALAAMDAAAKQRKLDAQWEIERLEARERAERVRPMDAATRQYQAEVRATISLAK
jgi:hypothetical protein